MCKNIKISIIIPIYNVEKYLSECLDGFINQTFKDIEIICINDGSIDGSLNILQDYAEKDSRIIIINQKNKGAGAARNKGIEVSTGDYLYFFDSDDFINVDALEKMYKKIVENDSDICICQKGIYNNQTMMETVDYWKYDFRKEINNKKIINPQRYRKNIYQYFPISIFIKLYKSTLIKENNINFQNIKTCNDVFFNFITLSLAKKITLIDEPLIRYRTEQKTNLSANRSKHINCIHFAFKFLKNSLIEKNLFEIYENTFSKRQYSNFNYELSLIKDKNRQKLCKKRLYKFLSIKFRIKNFLKIILETIFSIKNSKDKNYRKYKKITICGLEIKIKRGKG